MTGGEQLPSEPALIAAASEAGNNFFKTSQSKTDTLQSALTSPALGREPSLRTVRKGLQSRPPTPSRLARLRQPEWGPAFEPKGV